jgi:hypothetical protein
MYISAVRYLSLATCVTAVISFSSHGHGAKHIHLLNHKRFDHEGDDNSSRTGRVGEAYVPGNVISEVVNTGSREANEKRADSLDRRCGPSANNQVCSSGECCSASG